MKNEKLTAVTNKICELLKNGPCDPIRTIVMTMELKSEEEINNIRFRSPIREAELLAAFREAPIDLSYAISEDGIFLSCNHEYDISDCDGEWILGQPLSSQPAEVIDFLFNVLNCE